MDSFDIAIIGAGASGVLTAAHLHAAAPELRVAILDAGARAARGLAYGTPYGAHLLNVPAARMSALAQDPDHFKRWLEARGMEDPGPRFAPRTVYGEYLADVLGEACAPPSKVARVIGTSVGLARGEDGWRVHLHDGRVLAAKAVVLALGNLAPADPLKAAGVESDNYLRDPWAPGAAQGLDPEAAVLIIGTGLTMVDLALALRAEGHRGPIHALSRRGLLPQAHAPHAPRPLPAPPDPISPRAMLRWVREQVAQAMGEGADWRTVIDGIRPHTRRIWGGWSLAQKGSFLRHARAFWDVHRHRTAPEVGAEVQGLLASGGLQVHAGRVLSLHDIAGGVEVQWTRRGDAQPRILRVGRVINCTGPSSDYKAVDQPLVAHLRRAGWLVPDPLRLGVETDADGRLLDTAGKPVPGLFTLGPLRRPTFWESTAIPEIREQSQALSARLAAEV